MRIAFLLCHMVIVVIAANPSSAEAPPAFLYTWGSMGNANIHFGYPRGIATDDADYVYVADTENNRVQKFSSSGKWFKRFGTPGSGDGQIMYPFGVDVDGMGNVYVVLQI